MAEMTIYQRLQEAVAHHQAGRLEEAAALYRQILQKQPDYADAMHLLGALSVSQGNYQAAVDLIGKAIKIHPGNPGYHSNLGLALASLGWYGESAASLRTAIALKPDFAEAHINLSETLRQMKQFDESADAARKAIALLPNSSEAYCALGSVLREIGRLHEAIEAYQRATQLQPAQIQAWFNLGVLLVLDRQYQPAADAFERLTQLQPAWAEPFGYFGGCLRRLERIDESIIAFQHAVQVKPQLADAWNDLGSALRDRGDLEASIEAYRQAMEMDASLSSAHSNLIYAMHFHPASDQVAIAHEQTLWHQKYAAHFASRRPGSTQDRDPDRPLRIGYVSSHFFDHPDARLLLPVLEAHQPGQVSAHCYASVRQPDALTERHRLAASVWRDVGDLSDDELSRIVSEDQIDILVDLNLHTAHNRLATFARKPAPLQLSWLGYAGTSGLPAIDGWLSDDQLSPPGSAADGAVPLPGGWCYDPLNAQDEFEVSELAALKNGFVTFGALSDPARISTAVIHHWAAVLRAVRESRIILMCGSSHQRDQIVSTFASAGIASRRIEFVGLADRSERLRSHARVDLVLDTFPFNGTTSTCDALWMGAAVLSLSGSMPHTRTGRSLLGSAGLAGFAASSRARLVEIATEWSDPEKLVPLRRSLRDQMQSSKLMDAAGFTRELEACYRRLWKSWIERTAQGA